MGASVTGTGRRLSPGVGSKCRMIQSTRTPGTRMPPMVTCSTISIGVKAALRTATFLAGALALVAGSALAQSDGTFKIGMTTDMSSAYSDIAGKGSLREGLDARRATDLMVILNSHETFLGLTVGAGWTVEQYKAWLYLTMCEQLLAPAPPADLVAAAAGLSYHDELTRLAFSPT